MRTFIVGLWLASTLAAGVAVAQQAPFNEAGVTMGHWHLVSHDVAANKKIFVAMGGTPVTRGTAEGVWFPGARVNLNLGEEPPGKGGSVGSVINHVGFIVNNVQEQVTKWKAAGVPVLLGNNNRLDQAFVVTPDGVRVEILEDKSQAVPIQHEHVHFFVPEAVIPEIQGWYGKIFGAKPSVRNNNPVADVPGTQLRFNKAPQALATTKGRVLDHIGFDIVDLQGFIKKLEANGVKLDRPYTQQGPGAALAFITDPWGTYIELNQRPNPAYIN
jgi:catechol 2,3-dioxygenase-like lactoylglutathione lyase family enzyme